jgi:hypothetical protein
LDEESPFMPVHLSCEQAAESDYGIRYRWQFAVGLLELGRDVERCSGGNPLFDLVKLTCAIQFQKFFALSGDSV